MAMFVVLSKFTDQGAKNIQNLRAFAEANKARGERLGLKIHGWYLTQGRYDVVVIAEAPDAETMLASAAGIAGAGNNRTETLRASPLTKWSRRSRRALRRNVAHPRPGPRLRTGRSVLLGGWDGRATGGRFVPGRD